MKVMILIYIVKQYVICNVSWKKKLYSIIKENINYNNKMKLLFP